MLRRILAVGIALAMPVISPAYAEGGAAQEYEGLQRRLERKFAPPPQTRSSVPKPQKDQFQWINPKDVPSKAPVAPSGAGAQKSSMVLWDTIRSYFSAGAAELEKPALEAGMTDVTGTPFRAGKSASDKTTMQQVAEGNVPIAKKNSYVIQLKPSANDADIDALLNKYNLRVTKTIAPLGVITVEVKEQTRSLNAPPARPEETGGDAKARLERILEPPLIRQLRKEGIVNGAFVNTTLGSKTLPKASSAKITLNGETYSWRWRPGDGQDGNWGLKAMRMPPVWTILDRYRKANPDQKPPKIGIIDGGFVENPNVSFVSTKGIRPFTFHAPSCETHHGMHIAGIIGARPTPELEIEGVVPGASIDPVAIDDKILGDAASAGIDEVWEKQALLFDDVLLKTLNYVTDNMSSSDNLRVINISLGYNFVAKNLLGDTDPADEPSLALHILHQANLIRLMASRVEDSVLFVVAAGNDSEGRAKPLDARWASPFAWAGTQDSATGPRSKNILVVEAVDREGNRASFSNIGGHVAAPGVGIMSTLAGGRDALGICSGTSQATPFVSGLAAILFELDPSKTPAEIADIIRKSARAPKEGSAAASGAIDALEAVAELSPVNIRYAADLNGDGKVDEADLAIFSRQLASIESAATTNAPFSEDLNGDGVIDDDECYWPLIDINGSGRGAASGRDLRKMAGTLRSDMQTMAFTWSADAAVPFDVAAASLGLDRPQEPIPAANNGSSERYENVAYQDDNRYANEATAPARPRRKGPTACRGLAPPPGVTMAAGEPPATSLAVASAAEAAEADVSTSNADAVKEEVEHAVQSLKAQNPKLEVKINPATGMPSSISGLAPLPGAGTAGLGTTAEPRGLTQEEIARAVEAYFGEGGALWSAFPTKNKQAKTKLIGQRRDPDFPGRYIAEVEQQVEGIKIFGSSSKLTVDQSLSVSAFTGNMSNVALDDTKPTITEEGAKKSASAKLEELARGAPDPSRAFPLGPGAAEASKPELTVFDPALVGKKGQTRLAYVVVINAFKIFVDAHTGEAFYYYRDQPSGMLRRVFDLGQAHAFPGIRSIDEETRMRVDALSPEALQAFRNAGLVRDFYFLVFGRDSYNDGGAALDAYVRYGRQEAFWCTNKSTDCPEKNVMVYGQGFASAIDVVGHEMTHGIIANDPKLLYQNESGAVNESLADIFGTLIEFEAKGDAGNWLIGESAPGFSFTQPLRSLADPHLTDVNHKSLFDRNAPYTLGNRGQPDHYSELLTGDDTLCGSTFLQDNGCVHFNSGILNKFAYLVSEGGDHHGVSVVGIGRYKLGRIAYRAMTLGMTQTTTLMDAANAFVNACTDLTASQLAGIATSDCDQVRAARRAVGLGVEG